MTTLHAQRLTIRRSALGAQTPAPGSLPSVAISGISGDGTYVTFTAAGHGVLQWGTFLVAGCAPDAYNGWWVAAEVTGGTIKVYSDLTESATILGRLTPYDPPNSLGRYSYPVPGPGQEPLPVPVLGLIVIPGTLNWAVAYPGSGNTYVGAFTLYVRYLREGDEVWERHVSMDASLEMDSETPMNTTFIVNATWSEGGAPPGDYSLPLPELPIDEITRDEWCDDRADPKVWLGMGGLALNQFEQLEPCGVRDP